jgi:hypothetical protein
MLALGIVSLVVVLSVRGEAASLGIGVGIGFLAAVELVMVVRFLRAIDPDADLRGVLRLAGKRRMPGLKGVGHERPRYRGEQVRLHR